MLESIARPIAAAACCPSDSGMGQVGPAASGNTMNSRTTRGPRRKGDGPRQQLSLVLDEEFEIGDRQIHQRSSRVLEGGLGTALSMLVHQLFPANKTPQYQSRFEYDGIEVQLDGRDGIATSYDKNVLYYILSLLYERLRSGDRDIGIFTFSAQDYFKVSKTNNPGGTQHQQLLGSLNRLRHTSVKTTIAIGKREREFTDFSWLNALRIRYRGEPGTTSYQIMSITVELPRPLLTMLVRSELIPIETEIFKLSPMERRLYEIATAVFQLMGGHGFWMGLDELRARVGSSNIISGFRYELARILRNGTATRAINQPLVDQTPTVVSAAGEPGAVSRRIGPYEIELRLDPRMVPPGTERLRRDSSMRYVVIFRNTAAADLSEAPDDGHLPYVDYAAIIKESDR